MALKLQNMKVEDVLKKKEEAEEAAKGRDELPDTKGADKQSASLKVGRKDKDSDNKERESKKHKRDRSEEKVKKSKDEREPKDKKKKDRKDKKSKERTKRSSSVGACNSRVDLLAIDQQRETHLEIDQGMALGRPEGRKIKARIGKSRRVRKGRKSMIKTRRMETESPKKGRIEIRRKSTVRRTKVKIGKRSQKQRRGQTPPMIVIKTALEVALDLARMRKQRKNYS